MNQSSEIMKTLLGGDQFKLMPLELLVFFSIVFIVIGFARGVRAELWVTGFIILSYVILRFFTEALIAWTNRFYRLFLFGLRGGPFVENPIEVWDKIREAPPLIESDIEKLLFTLAVFFLFYLLGFIIGRAAVRRRLAEVSLALLRQLPDLGERLLGAVIGGINGFLIANFVLPRLLPAKKETVIVVPSTEVLAQFMRQNLVNVGVALLVIIILLGLMASGGIRPRG